VSVGDSPLGTEPGAEQAPVNGDEEDAFRLTLHDETRFAIVSQSCDIVESARAQPWVKVSPVVSVAEGQRGEAERGYMPGLAPIPAISAFADLRRAVTVDKTLFLFLDAPTARLAGDDEQAMFQGVVHRHFSRAAFPDDVTPALSKLRARLRDKKGKVSEEGRPVDAITEIRLAAIRTGRPSRLTSPSTCSSTRPIGRCSRHPQTMHLPRSRRTGARGRSSVGPSSKKAGRTSVRLEA
jgi:hypothetical protein